MLVFWISATVLGITGFLVMAANALHRPRALTDPLRRRGVDPHLWGFHLLGMSLLLEVVLLLLQERAWKNLAPAARAAVVLAGVWIGAAGTLAVLALLASPSRRGRAAPMPAPRAPLGSWSGAYRVFLAAGLASLLVLAAFVFSAS